jgi:hypothetical protein
MEITRQIFVCVSAARLGVVGVLQLMRILSQHFSSSYLKKKIGAKNVEI